MKKVKIISLLTLCNIIVNLCLYLSASISNKTFDINKFTNTTCTTISVLFFILEIIYFSMVIPIIYDED